MDKDWQSKSFGAEMGLDIGEFDGEKQKNEGF